MDYPLTGEGDQGHALFLARLEPRRSSGRDTELESERLRAIEAERPIYFEKMAMRSDLDRTISGIPYRELFRLAADKGFNVLGRQQHFAWNDRLRQFGANNRLQ
jgi:hypothetical protein